MWNRDIAPDFIEKIISSLCYLPMGFFIGIGYILFNGKGSNNRFFRFHFFQSIILMIMITILQMGSKSVTGIFVALLQIVAAPFLSDFGVVVEAAGLAGAGFNGPGEAHVMELAGQIGGRAARRLYGVGGRPLRDAEA